MMGKMSAAEGSGLTMLSPMIGCARICRSSSAFSGPGLRRIASGTAILPMAWMRPPRIQRNQIRFLKAESCANAKGGIRHPLWVVFRVGILCLRGRRERDDDLFGAEADWQSH